MTEILIPAGKRVPSWLLACSLVTLPACAVYTPPTDPPRDFLERVVTETSRDVSVSAVVLSDEEAEQYFGVPLAKNDIQAVWLDLENASDETLAVNYLSIDDDYFAPGEAAQMSRRFGERRTLAKTTHFYEQTLPVIIEPGSSASGFVYTNHDPGAKAFDVELLGDGESHRLEFAMTVPGLEADFHLTRPNEIYTEDELTDLDLAGLRTYLEELPCCVLGGDGETPGDPLNVVIVGDGNLVLQTLVRRGWDLTETLRLGTSWRTAVSSVFGSRYRTSPVSPLILFDRPQDAAFQKARNTVDERNHLRLWRAPVTLDGQAVWIGQISRDIGVKLSSRSFVTHRIDSVVDEARTYLMLDVIESDNVASFGYVAGVGLSTVEDPRENYTRDPYFTDGLRAVLILSDVRLGFGDIENLEWEPQPRQSVLQSSASGDGESARD